MKKRHRRKPLYFELPKTGTYVHYTYEPASKCQPGAYRSSMHRGTQVVICCPRKTKMDPKSRCCKIGTACASKPITQSVRVPVEIFAKRHPALYKKLMAARPGRRGEKTLRVK